MACSSVCRYSIVLVKGLVSVTLTVEDGSGRVHEFRRVALPDVRRIKAAVERQKEKAGLYE